MTHTVLLTDDELVTLIVLADSRLDRPLQTVHTDDAADVRRAVVRGARSLVLRGLMDEEAVDTETLYPALVALLKGPVVVVATVDDSLVPVDGADLICLHILDEAKQECVLSWSRPAGTHSYYRCPMGEGLSTLADLATAAEDRAVAVFFPKRGGAGSRGWVIEDSEISELIAREGQAEWDRQPTVVQRDAEWWATALRDAVGAMA